MFLLRGLTVAGRRLLGTLLAGMSQRRLDVDNEERMPMTRGGRELEMELHTQEPRMRVLAGDISRELIL